MRLMATSYDAVKEVAPETQVISGGLVGNDIGYLEQMYDAVEELELESVPFDLVGVHPFTGSAPPSLVDPERVYERPQWGLFDENFTGYTALHDVMVDRGDADKPIYISQFGYSTKAFQGGPAGARRRPRRLPDRGVRRGDLHAVRRGVLVVLVPRHAVGPAELDPARPARTSPTSPTRRCRSGARRGESPDFAPVRRSRWQTEEDRPGSGGLSSAATGGASCR